MVKRTQLEEIRMLRRALADLYSVHTGLWAVDRLGAVKHLHCASERTVDMKLIEAGVRKSAEAALRETAKKGY